MVVLKILTFKFGGLISNLKGPICEATEICQSVMKSKMRDSVDVPW
jgi:hypothetical protein